MFDSMRRKDRQISKDEAMDILSSGSFGVFSTISENGYPSGTPLNYASDSGAVYVHVAAGSASRAAAHCAKVCFTVVTRSDVVASEFVTNYESVMVHGTAEELDGQAKFDALLLLVKKYSQAFEESGIEHIHEDIDNCLVLKINIEHIAGKARKG